MKAMQRIKLSPDYTRSGFTVLDNVFFEKYLKPADGNAVKVYLYALHVAQTGGDGIGPEGIALGLGMSEKAVAEALNYWEEKNLISITDMAITFHSVKAPLAPARKYNAKKYAEFVEELQRLFPDKVIYQEKIALFVELMEDYKFEPSAMLATIAYCCGIRKTTASVAEILDVATKWAKEGITTAKSVEERIKELELNNDDMRAIFLALGLKSPPDVSDGQLLRKWTKDWGFNLDVILVSAKACKKSGGMAKLDRHMAELRTANARTAPEASDFFQKKDDTRELAMDIVRTLGKGFLSADMVVDNYLIKWQAMGFEDKALLAIAKYSVFRSKNEINAFSALVSDFYSKSLITEATVTAFIEEEFKADKLIAEVLTTAGLIPNVTDNERNFYRTHASEWGFSHPAILAVARHAKGKLWVPQYMAKTLASLRQSGRFTVEDIEATLTAEEQKEQIVVDLEAKKHDAAVRIARAKEKEKQVKETLSENDRLALLRTDEAYATLEAERDTLAMQIGKLGSQNPQSEDLKKQRDKIEQKLEARRKILEK